jgi:photosystem II stability/assembly factor-like uncharacterized protein
MFVTLLRICAVALCFYASSIMLHSQSIEWQRLEGMEGSYITSITQTKSGVIFIGTPYSLWSSRDTLRTWQKVSLSGTRDSLIYGLAATDDGGLLVSTFKGVYRTSDNGITWATVTPAAGVTKWRYIYAHSSGVCFAGATRRLFRSTNHGRSWSSFADTIVQLSRLKRQLPTPVIGQDGRIIFRNYYMDNGQKWQRNATPNNNYGSDEAGGGVIASTTDGKGTVIYGRRQVSSSNGTISISRDNGVNFETYRYDIEPQNPGSEFISSTEDMFYTDLVYNQALIVGDTVLLSYFGRGIFKSPLHKNHPYISPKDMTYNGANTQYPTCLYRLHNGIILMGSYGNGLFRSDDNGTHWEKVHLPFNYPVITHIVSDDQRNIIYASTMNGLYSSTTAGLEWKREDSGFFRPCVTKVFCLDDGKVFAINHDRIYRKDNGRWYNVNLTDIRTIRGIIHINDTVHLFNAANHYSAGEKGAGPFVKKNLLAKTIYNIIYVPLQKTFVMQMMTSASIAYSKDNLKTYSIPFEIIKETYLNEVTVEYAYFLFLRSSPYSSRVYCGTQSGVFALDTKDNYFIPARNDDWLDKKFIFDVAINQIDNAYAVTDGLYILPAGKSTWEQAGTPPQIASPMLLTAVVDVHSYLYTSSIYGGLFRTVVPTVVLEKPLLKVPADNAQQLPLIDMGVSWNADKKSALYHVQVSKTSDFSTIFYQDSSITTTSTFFPTLDNNSTYYWRVQSRLFGVRSPWSEIRSFSTLTVYPSKVTLRQPANKEINRPVTVSLLWNPTTEADSFDVHVASDNAFTMTALRDSMIAKREIQLNNLQQGTEYFWRVRGKNRAGYGPWSETWSFTTQSPSGISEDDNSGMSVTVQNNHVILHYGAYSQSVKGIRITDIRGKTILSQTIEQGQSSSDFDMSGMSKGYYVVILDTHTGSISRNVIVE